MKKTLCNLIVIKVSQLAQVEWFHKSDIWQGNIVIFDPNSKNTSHPYKIATGVSAVKIAVDQVKRKLGWMNSYPN